MRSVALAALVSLAFVGFAAAAHRVPPLVIPNNPSEIPDGEIEAPLHAPVPRCMKIVDIKDKNPQVHFEVLGAGAYHFVEGVYAGQKPVGVMPPGEGPCLRPRRANRGER